MFITSSRFHGIQMNHCVADSTRGRYKSLSIDLTGFFFFPLQCCKKLIICGKIYLVQCSSKTKRFLWCRVLSYVNLLKWSDGEKLVILLQFRVFDFFFWVLWCNPWKMYPRFLVQKLLYWWELSICCKFFKMIKVL